MDKKIGERIRMARKASGLTQDDLAYICGYKHKSSITKIEAGETDLPTEKLNTLAAALGVSTIYLTTGMQPPEETAPLKGWVDDFLTTAGKLSKQRRVQLLEFAQFLTMLDQREQREAFLRPEDVLGEKFPVEK